ncbi:MAG: ubiquinol-cytochrome c reductase iron-sulfur subunit [Pseudomonadota bacterium]
MADITEQQSSDPHSPDTHDGGTRREFLYLTTAGVGVVGVGVALWPFINSMNPAADTLALATVDVDLSGLEVGQAVTVSWQGKPVFIRYRTPEEIAEAENVDLADLPDPVPDSERVEDPNYLVVVGICTHLGCIPLGQKATDPRGDYGGYFCPCHGSHYDTSGRIRLGPAPSNLDVPEYAFGDEQQITIGEA